MNDTLKNEADYFGSIIQDLQEQNKRYREALEFYADRDNYKEFYDVMRERKVMMIIEDGGKKAREALEGEE